jgi:hypothetical protein
VLAFRPYISGELTLPQAIPPDLASALCDFLAPAKVFVANLDFTPRATTVSDGTFALSTGTEAGIVHHHKSSTERTISLDVTTASDSFSRSYTCDLLTLPANATALAPHTGTVADIFPHLACGVLLAADYEVSRICLPPQVAKDKAGILAANVLRSSGLSLEFHA